MITKQRQLFYFVGDQPFKTIEEAQRHDLKEILQKSEIDWDATSENHIIDWMMQNAAAIVDTLTTTPTSRAKARKTNGGTKKSPKRPKLQPAELPKE